LAQTRVTERLNAQSAGETAVKVGRIGERDDRYEKG